MVTMLTVPSAYTLCGNLPKTGLHRAPAPSALHQNQGIRIRLMARLANPGIDLYPSSAHPQCRSRGSRP